MSLYDISKPFDYNCRLGPFWEGNIPRVPQCNKPFSFLGHSVNSLFGASASPLTHGCKGVRLLSQLGYDIITYRSVRSKQWSGQPYPHWRYVDVTKQLSVEDLNNPVRGNDKPFSLQDVTTANSFGIQSTKPEYWQRDVEKAKHSLQKGQLLILSIMFTPEEGKNVIKDAAEVARYAKETSVIAFEINLAHPNSGMKSLVYEDIETSVAICKSIKKIITDRPLIAKVGYYKNQQLLTEFLKQTNGLIEGISSTNTYAMTIIDAQGKELFPYRPKAGVSGNAIRTLSMQQAKTIINQKIALKLDHLAVIGIGGVIKPKHIQQYIDLGVDAVQAATGIWADPLLAIKYKRTLSQA